MGLFKKKPILEENEPILQNAPKITSPEASDCESLFVQYMHENGIEFLDAGDGIFRISYNAESLPTVSVYTVFLDNKTDVYFRSTAIAKADSSKTEKAMSICNQLNQEYHWAKFYVADGGEIYTDMDAILNPQAIGEECISIIEAMVSVIDKAYPKLMQAIWF